MYRDMARRFNAEVLREGLGQAGIVWGFNSACLEIFQDARAADRARVVEQTILPSQLEHELLREEIERWPDWQPGLDIPAHDQQTIDRAHQEWERADRILAGSDFVRDGLKQCGVPEDKISVAPYGVDVDRFRPASQPVPNEGPLRVLFVGEVGLRKGVPYLLHALHELGASKVVAKLAGGIALRPEVLRSFSGVAQLVGPVPRVQMPDLYRWADVFVLPSIVEGSSVATYEALLSGLPVITTPNAGSLVRDGVDGFIVPIRDSRALANAVMRYEANRDLLAKHREAAMQARHRLSLQRYQRDLISVVASLR